MPEWTSHLRSRLTTLRLSPTREAEIVEELAQHLEDRWRELVAQGATPDEAAHRARTEFDGARLEALLGTLRQAHWHELPPPGPSRAFSFDSVLIDLRHAIRALRATPSFTIGALLEPIEQRIERIEVEDQPPARLRLDELPQLVAVTRPRLQHGQQEQFGRPLLQFAVESRQVDVCHRQILQPRTRERREWLAA